MARAWTEKQSLAISTRDRTLLVSAAAGSGKTATLTERIIRSILDDDNPIDISEMLIVTFTNAATGELKERIAAAVRSALAERPGDERLERQLHMLPSARISTIDAFCSDILRANCERVGVNPAYRIADEAEAELLAEGILDAMFGEIYDGAMPEVATAAELEQLSDCLTDTRSQDDLAAVVRMFYYSTTDTEAGVGTLRNLIEEYNTERFTSVEKTRFGAHVMRCAREYAEHYVSVISRLLREHEDTGDSKCDKRIAVLRTDLSYLNAMLGMEKYSELRELLRSIAFDNTPTLRGYEQLKVTTDLRRMMKEGCKRITEDFFEYSEDEWRSTYGELYRILSVLVRVVEKFHDMFRAEKLRLGVCEYSDVSRYTYECLWQNGERTDVAIAEADKYRAVYVDEYQDVNAVQHKIFEAISTATNRFMVGDIKQSIYGFRSADPTIFAAMKTSYPALGEEGDYPAASIFMSDNFRCDEGIIDFVNGIFDNLFSVLSESIGFVREDRLCYRKQHDGSAPEYFKPRLCLVPRSRSEDADVEDEDGCEAEALLVAEKIDELLRCGRLDNGKPVRPGDIAIIMRNAKGKDKKYAAALHSLDIPCAVADTTSFFLNPEILLTMSLLNVIDNPRRDVYLAAALCSPIFSFTADELAALGKVGESTLYDSLVKYVEDNPDFEKGQTFLSWLLRYRIYSEGVAVDVLINRIYRDTGLMSLASRGGGREYLLRFYEHARRFEASAFRGLYNFINYVNGVIDRGNSFDKREAVLEGDTVKIITAHSSKGLEFPIVFYVGTEQAMKRAKDERDRLVYESRFGIAMYLRSENGLSLVENPTKKIVLDYRLRQKIEEEARVLYVILTRAREQLYIVGKARGDLDKYRSQVELVREMLDPYTVYGIKSYTDMITYSSGIEIATPEELVPDMSERLRVMLGVGATDTENEISGEAVFDVPDELPDELRPTDEPARVELSEAGEENGAVYIDGERLSDLLLDRFTFKYPYAELAELPEKLSVSRLYPEILDPSDGEAQALDSDESKERFTKMGRLPAFATGSDETESAKRGIATHLLFQFCDFERLRDEGAQAELHRLKEKKYISERDAERVRIKEVEMFRSSRLFRDILAARRIYRELRFNTRLPAHIFTTDTELAERLWGREILVQGVIDCLYEDNEGNLHLIDYKTDRLRYEERQNPDLAESRLFEAHSLQLSYYSMAVERMFGKAPVTVEVYSLHLGRTVNVKR